MVIYVINYTLTLKEILQYCKEKLNTRGSTRYFLKYICLTLSPLKFRASIAPYTYINSYVNWILDSTAIVNRRRIQSKHEPHLPRTILPPKKAKHNPQQRKATPPRGAKELNLPSPPTIVIILKEVYYLFL